MIFQLTTFLTNFAATSGAACNPTDSFLGMPTWYKYLPGVIYNNTSTGVQTCVVKITAISEFWLIIAAILEIMLRLGALVSLGFIIFGGIQFVMSEGNPDKSKKALNTVISACVGLAITIVSTAAVTFIAGRF